MSHTNYNGISTKPAKDETETLVDPEKTVDTTPIPNTNIEEMVAVPKQLISGTVSDCALLNVRENPDTNAKILFTISKGTSVLIDLESSTAEWYKVFVNNQEGFCMKKYISLPQ